MINDDDLTLDQRDELTWQDYDEIEDVLIAMNNLMFTIHEAESTKIDTWNRIRKRVAYARFNLKLKEEALKL